MAMHKGAPKSILAKLSQRLEMNPFRKANIAKLTIETMSAGIRNPHIYCLSEKYSNTFRIQ